MRKFAIILMAAGLYSVAGAGTMVIKGLPATVNTSAGPVVLPFDIVSNGQLTDGVILAWAQSGDPPTGGSLGCAGAVNHICPGQIYCDDFSADIIDYVQDIWPPEIWSDSVWAPIALPIVPPQEIVGDLITDLTLTIPQGFEGTLEVKVLNETSGEIGGVAAVEAYADCLPNTPEYAAQYAQWVALGKPDCWCNDYGDPRAPGNQCYGDAAGNVHRKGCIVFVADLTRLSDSWQAKIGDPHLDPCADFGHQSHRKGYIVYTTDLEILATNWMRTTLPGDCPLTDAEIGL